MQVLYGKKWQKEVDKLRKSRRVADGDPKKRLTGKLATRF
jgi:hypothetical protein